MDRIGRAGDSVSSKLRLEPLGASRCESVFFFFQAEDGIRDLTVTGVQTCALPISEQAALGRVATLVAEAVPPGEVFTAVAAEAGALFGVPLVGLFRYERQGVATEIGRASCRERV